MAHYEKGFALARLKRYDEAVRCYDEAIALKPDDVASHIARGIALRFLRKHDEAIRCFDEAIQLKPDVVTTYREKGITLAQIGRHDMAVGCFETARIPETRQRTHAHSPGHNADQPWQVRRGGKVH